ncbi:hypothetical protein KFE25_004960 [Diacronema lutheri]|uniref:Uncharacterized protein n=1 Tax=Diacronema lutheri TaxID=2081491 RepID=A0A8J6C893_DIALT|nr:hypothetical protein KFE25_004960 [Diacronema lutheri]
MDAATFIRMRYERMHTEAQRKAQQRVREAAKRNQPMPRGRFAARSLPKALQELSQSSVIARSLAPAHSNLSSLPALTLETPSHILILADLADPATPAETAKAGGAIAAVPANLVEQRARAHSRIALALLRRLIRSPAAPLPAAGETAAGWAAGAGEELGPAAERLDLAFEHLKRMEALLLSANKLAGVAGSGARAANARRRAPADSGASSGGAQAAIDGTRRQELLSVAYSNLAVYYVRRGLPRPALDYCFRAAAIERRLYDRVEFTTHLRTAAALTDLSCNEDALSHCEQAWKSLLLCARTVTPQRAAHADGVGADGAGVGTSAANDGGREVAIEELPAEYVAAAAVVCCNLAVSLVHLHRHVEALEVALQAEQYAARALGPTHEHRQATAACARYARVFAEYREMLEGTVRAQLAPGGDDEEFVDEEGEAYRSNLDEGGECADADARALPSLRGPSGARGSYHG